MGNVWMDHVKKVWAKNKGKKSYRETLQEARKSYKPKPSSKVNSSSTKVKGKKSKPLKKKKKVKKKEDTQPEDYEE
jgi:hypothetical protein